MTDKNATDKERFNSLLDSYAVAVYLSGQLLDSGILERKIKIGNDTKRVDEIMRVLVPFLANDLRAANRKLAGLKNPEFAHGDFFNSSLDIANAYFDDLATKGSEWEHADLENLFTEYKRQAEEEMELARNRW